MQYNSDASEILPVYALKYVEVFVHMMICMDIFIALLWCVFNSCTNLLHVHMLSVMSAKDMMCTYLDYYLNIIGL